MWPDKRIQELLGVDLPIIQAPMAGSVGSEMVIEVSEAGGLGSLPCAMLTSEQVRAEVGIIRQRTPRPINLNFFCHQPPEVDVARETAWKKRLEPYYTEFGFNPAAVSASTRGAFDQTMCDIVVDLCVEVVSFHFGLPERSLLGRVKATGAKIISSATTVDEARWLEGEGCDAIIAQGYEAGGHRGMFLDKDVSAQAGTIALVPQVVDAVKVPVIAAGGIADGRGIAAAFALGASAVQIGTAFLFCPEAKIHPLHRAALKSSKDNSTVLTNVFTGRPARGIVNRIIQELGPMFDLAPSFPLASGAVSPLRAKAEAVGSIDFTPLWSGQAAALGREVGARQLTRTLADEAQDRLHSLQRRTRDDCDPAFEESCRN